MFYYVNESLSDKQTVALSVWHDSCFKIETLTTGSLLHTVSFYADDVNVQFTGCLQYQYHTNAISICYRSCYHIIGPYH